MQTTIVHPSGAKIRWVELPGTGPGPARVYIHGLGACAAPYFAGVATHPLLAGRRSLLVDLLGFGISDHPADFGYTLEDHADTLADALGQAGVAGADVIGHSMGGAVAIVLAARHPEVVSRLVIVDGNLDPRPPTPGAPSGSGIAGYTEQEFLAYGRHEVRDRVGEHWWATMRLAHPVGLYRSAASLARATVPTMREMLVRMSIPRAYLYPDADPPHDAEGLREAGVDVVEIPDSGHNIMLDNPDAFAATVARLAAPV
ncbi:alpha/beta fold hydrolase [Nonomuraea sp. NPDC059194]|uniref:alpha/beta fold hydrolase n=1 Tax=Nonomuraea sp. NPDC059194 TaxID=3346764 RepID=UPI0036A739D2